MSPFPRDEHRPWPSRNHQLLFGAAIALSAIQALDYAFVDRETGISASDDLASGLIPSSPRSSAIAQSPLQTRGAPAAGPIARPAAT